MGKFRIDEYDGGVALDDEPWEVVGLCADEEYFSLEDVDPDAAAARRFDEEPLSRGDGEPDLVADNSFNLFCRNNCSNCPVNSFAHSSPY